MLVDFGFNLAQYWASLAALVVLLVFLVVRTPCWHRWLPKTTFLVRFPTSLGRNNVKRVSGGAPPGTGAAESTAEGTSSWNRGF